MYFGAVDWWYSHLFDCCCNNNNDDDDDDDCPFIMRPKLHAQHACGAAGG